MSDDPYKLWRRKQRRRARIATIVLVVMAVLLVGLSIGLFSFYRFTVAQVSEPEVRGILRVGLLVLYVPLALMAVVALFSLRDVAAERRLVELVPRHGGRVCAGCRAPFEGDAGTCARCGAEWTVEGLREHWEAYITGTLRRSPWSMRRGVRGAIGRFLVRTRESPRRAIAFQLTIVAVVVVLLAVTSSRSLLATAMSFGWMVFMFVGFALIGNGRALVGNARRCAKCRYEKAPGEELPLCPECGAEWTLLGGTIRGERRKSNGAANAIGIACLAIAALLVVSPLIVGRGWLVSKAPTAMLIRAAIDKPGFTIDEWTELGTRVLSSEQRDELARGVIARRARDGYLSREANAWFLDSIADGTLSAPVVEDFYAGMVEFGEGLLSRAEVGEVTGLALRLRVADPLFQKLGAHVAVGAVRLDGAATDARSTHAALCMTLEELPDFRWHRYADPDVQIAMPTSPGEVRVSVDLWSLYMPTAQSETPLVWNDDGTVAPPASAVWSGMRTVEWTIRVTPRD